MDLQTMASSARLPTFRAAVENVLNNWTALQLAVEHGMGGQESRQIAKWMIDVVENFFYENDCLQSHEVADFLSEIMNNEFETICEDDSPEEIGKKLCRYFKMCTAKEDEKVKAELFVQPKCNLKNCQAADVDENEDQQEEGVMEEMGKLAVSEKPPETNLPDIVPATEDISASKEEPAEEGWNVVRKGKKH